MELHEKLNTYIEAARFKPFVWGSWDCCQFVAGWLSELTGADPRELFPAYADEAGARDILSQSGGLVGLVGSVLEEIHPALAKVGDVILCNEASGTALGICLGVRSAHVGADGLVFPQTIDALKAWRAQPAAPEPWRGD